MEYRATYRRTQTALPGLLLVLIGTGLVIAYEVTYAGHDKLTVMMWALGLAVFGIFFIFANTYRIHSWTVQGTRLEVSERPRIPLTGLPRRASVDYGEIAAFHRVESGLDYLVEIATRDGRVYRLPQALIADPKGFGRPDPDANLDVFADAIYSAARAAGHPLPEPSEGLSFWNSLPGLLFLGIVFVLALAIALLAAWALLAGGFSSSTSRAGYGAAIAILLPFGAGWLLRRSWRRRRAVLAQRV
ncbi:MAG: hypothetical protein QM676_03560 [Novosphingobium sp.]